MKIRMLILVTGIIISNVSLYAGRIGLHNADPREVYCRFVSMGGEYVGDKIYKIGGNIACYIINIDDDLDLRNIALRCGYSEGCKEAKDIDEIRGECKIVVPRIVLNRKYVLRKDKASYEGRVPKEYEAGAKEPEPFCTIL